MFGKLFGAFTFGVPACMTFFDVVGRIAKVEGASMQPTLNPHGDYGDYVLLNRWSVRRFTVNRGDIVALSSPKDPDQKLIKRVVGVPGDRVITLGYKVSEMVVPQGHCWLEGDHHERSLDSNLLGAIPLGLIEARATHIVWPPHRFGPLLSSAPIGRIVNW